MTDCTWNSPGQDAYTGTPRAAIMAMAEIPQATRLVLADRADVHDFDDVVMIDRDSIRSRAHDYAPELRSMAFGSRGKVCATVTRAGWAPEHVESAMVFCEGVWCVARPSICNNWALVTRLARPPVVALQPPEVEAPALPTVAPEWVAFGLPSEPADEPAAPTWGSPWPAPFPIAYGPPALPPVHVLPALCPAIPEPSTWALMLAGLALAAALRRVAS